MEDDPGGDRSHTSEVIASRVATTDFAAHVGFVIETQPHPPARLAHRGRDERPSARTAIRRILWAVGRGGRADRSRISVYRGAASAAAGGFSHLGIRGERPRQRFLPSEPWYGAVAGETISPPTPTPQAAA